MFEPPNLIISTGYLEGVNTDEIITNVQMCYSVE